MTAPGTATAVGEVVPESVPVPEYVKPPASATLDPVKLKPALVGFAEASTKNQYVKACTHLDEIHATCGGNDIPTALEGIANSSLPELTKSLLSVLVGEQAGQCVYQFCGNVKASRHDLGAIDRAVATAGEIVKALGK